MCGNEVSENEINGNQVNSNGINANEINGNEINGNEINGNPIKENEINENEIIADEMDEKDVYRIKAVLKSPLMVGGKKLNNNFRESKDYIPGSVLRAAYARALIHRCAFEQKDNWLAYQAQSQCETCAFQTVCKSFSEISFPALYPLGGSPYPVTAREKKYKEEDEAEIFDLLKSRLTGQEKVQGESEWSRLEGIHEERASKYGQKIKLMHAAISRTAIAYQRNAAKEGSLYTQNVVLEKYMDKNKELCDVAFYGAIRLSEKEKEAFSQIRILHIGADATRGFGICHMSFEKETAYDTPQQVKTRIDQFNEGIAGSQKFVVVDLLTDAYLGLEDIGADFASQADFSDAQMLAFLEDKIGLPKETYHLRKAYKFQEVHRGIDTSKETETKMRRPARLVVQAGAVFVYQAEEKQINEAELCELEEHGIGNYTEHGFGKIRICDKFHVVYGVSGAFW